MADKYAGATGNWSTLQWYLEAAKTNTTTKPGAGDNAYSNTYTVTIDENVTCDNINSNGSGGFTVSSNRTINANCLQGVTLASGATGTTINGNVGGLATGTVNTFGVGITSGMTITINGSITGQGTGNNVGFNTNSGGTTLTVNLSNGQVIRGGAGGTTAYAINFGASAGGTLTINGTGTTNILGGVAVASYAIVTGNITLNTNITVTNIGSNSGATGSGISFGATSGNITITCTKIEAPNVATGYGIIMGAVTGNVNITCANLYGGAGASAYGMRWSNISGTLTFTGNINACVPNLGSGTGVYADGSGTIIINGNVYGNTGSAVSANGINTLTTCSQLITVNGNVYGGTSSGATNYGIQHQGSNTLIVNGTIYGGTTHPYNYGVVCTKQGGTGKVVYRSAGFIAAGGASPIAGSAFYATNEVNNMFYGYLLTGVAQNLIHPNAIGTLPTEANVRLGTIYGGGTYVGSLAVPSVNSVAYGIAVDNTTGTAVLTQTGAQDAMTAQGYTTDRALYLDLIPAIGSGTGAALNFAPIGDNTAAPLQGITFVGTQTGTYENVAAEDGTRHQIVDSGGTPDIDIVYKFAIGAGRNAAKVEWRGYVTNSDTVTFQAWNGTTWDTRATVTGTNATSNVTKEIPLLATHTGLGTEAGNVYIRLTSTAQSNITVRTDTLLVSGVSVGITTGYSDGAIWVKASGVSGTTPFINGTADNPCPWADAQVLSTSVGLKRYRIVNDETITLTQATEAVTMVGQHWYLVLNGQSINDSYVEGADVTGIAVGTDHWTMIDCEIGAITCPPVRAFRCGIGLDSGTFTAASNGQYVLIDCYSMVPGSGIPVFDFNTNITSTTGLNIRRWSGGSNITGNANVTCSMEVVTGGGQTITTGGGNFEVRGICRAVTVTSSGSSVTQVAAVTGPVTVNGSGGTVRVYGVVGSLTDNSAGTVTITNLASNTNDIDIDTSTLTPVRYTLRET